MALTRERYLDRLRRVRLLAMDVDGVLSDGSIVYGDGDWEGKIFFVRDGSAIYMARQLEVRTAVITGRSSAAVARRIGELPFTELCQGVLDKRGTCLQIQEEYGIDDDEVAYIGDDLLDLAVMEHAGLGITVADAHPRVVERADWVTEARGGRGAVREVVDDIVTARGLWERILESYRIRGGGETGSGGAGDDR